MTTTKSKVSVTISENGPNIVTGDVSPPNRPSVQMLRAAPRRGTKARRSRIGRLMRPVAAEGQRTSRSAMAPRCNQLPRFVDLHSQLELSTKPAEANRISWSKRRLLVPIENSQFWRPTCPFAQ